MTLVEEDSLSTDVVRALSGYPRCQLDGCDNWRGEAGQAVLDELGDRAAELAPGFADEGYLDLYPWIWFCDHHAGQHPYKDALSAIDLSNRRVAPGWQGPENLGWERIEGRPGALALSWLRRHTDHTPKCSECLGAPSHIYHAVLKAVRQLCRDCKL